MDSKKWPRDPARGGTCVYSHEWPRVNTMPRWIAIAILTGIAWIATAQDAKTIRVLGNSHMETLMSNWEGAFRSRHPDVRFENRYLGTANAIAGLYLETADLALMGREIMPIETIAYRRAFRHDPVEIAVATASYDVPLETFAFAIFVHRDNPITHLTFAQLRSVFGCDKPNRTWGELGVGGYRSTHAIHLYGYEINSGLGMFFASKVMNGVRLWNCSLHEYANQYDANGKLLANAGDLMVRDLANDPDGIAFCGYGHHTARVKSLALAQSEGEAPIDLTREHVADRSYPLTRTVYIYVHHDREHPASNDVREFFRYVLSEEGQRTVALQNVYLPLPPAFARQQLKKLD